MHKKRAFWLGLIGVFLGLILGSFWLVEKVKKDRESAMNFGKEPKVQMTTNRSGEIETKTYTQEDIEKARKEGRLPPELRQTPIHTPPQNNAVQRSLKTVEEINRINQMNQRLMDQNGQNRP